MNVDGDNSEGGKKTKDADLKYDKEDVRREVEEAYIDEDGKSEDDDEEDLATSTTEMRTNTMMNKTRETC